MGNLQLRGQRRPYTVLPFSSRKGHHQLTHNAHKLPLLSTRSF